MPPQPQSPTSGISKAKQLPMREEAPSPLASPLSSPTGPWHHIPQDHIIISSPHCSAQLWLCQKITITVVKINIMVFWVMAPCSLVDGTHLLTATQSHDPENYNMNRNLSFLYAALSQFRVELWKG
jgi:hypothetical protein